MPTRFPPARRALAVVPQAVACVGAQIARGAAIQFAFVYLAVPIGADDRELVHGILLLCPEPELVGEHPKRGLPDVFMHGGGGAADHPAVSVAGANLCAHCVGLRAVPHFVPCLCGQIAHDLLVLCAVAGHYVPVGVDEKGVEAHVAGQKPLLTVNVLNQAVVEVRAEPFFGAAACKQRVD